MKRLVQHIEYLLIAHDCVIVPGLGAFIASSKPACIDYASHRLIPPSRSVAFNHAVTNDDGLLANSFARKYSLSFEEARQVIIKEVEDLMNLINRGDTVSLGRVGTLVKGEESNLIFHPSGSLFGDGLGLMALSFILNLSEPELQSEIAKDRPSVFATSDLTDVEENDDTTLNFDSQNGSDSSFDEISDNKEKKYYHIRISRALVNYAAFFALIVSLLFAVLLNPVPHDSREQRASVVPMQSILNVSNEKTFESESSLREETNEPETTLEDEVSLQEITLTSEEPQPHAYYLIVGTFHDRSEAENYVSKNQSEEHPLFVVPSRKLVRVAASSSDNKEDLQLKLNSSSFLRKFPNAWIWTR